LDEVSRGDAAYAADRRKLLETFASLAITPEVEDLARQLKAALNLPERATVDSLHLAVAAVHQIVCYLDDDLDSDHLIKLGATHGHVFISPRAVGTRGQHDARHLL
jgi:hypothetical protein